jgi:hypothetical protein
MVDRKSAVDSPDLLLAAVPGSMLSDSIVYGYAYIGPDFSDACLRRMDGEQAPWASERDIAARRSPASRGSPSL